MSPSPLDLRRATGLLADLSLLRVEGAGPALHLCLNRRDERGAMNEARVRQLHTASVDLPVAACVAAISGEGAGRSEGQRGIFVGGSGSARIPRLIGVSRMKGNLPQRPAVASPQEPSPDTKRPVDVSCLARTRPARLASGPAKPDP